MRILRTILLVFLATALVSAAAAPALAEKGRSHGKDDSRDAFPHASDDKRSKADVRARGSESANASDDEDDDDDDDDRDDDRRERDRKPRFHAHGDRWLLRNDNISVWFHSGHNGKAKPELRVAQTGADGNRTGYAIALKHLVEVGPGKENESKRFAAINLAKKDDWNVVTNESARELTLTMVRAEAQGIVTLVFHISKVSPSVKFDVKVDNWRWAANAKDHRLALVMVTHGKALHRDGDASATLDGGYVRWATTATVKYGDVSRVVNVTGATDREGKDGRLVLTFDAPGGYDSLDYDPELGVMSASASERAVASPWALGAVALAAAAVVSTRRRDA